MEATSDSPASERFIEIQSYHLVEHMEKGSQFKALISLVFNQINGGGRGIRTPGTLTRSTVFKTAAFNHSAIPPALRVQRVLCRKPQPISSQVFDFLQKEFGFKPQGGICSI